MVTDKVLNEVKEKPKNNNVINDENVQKRHWLVLPFNGDKGTNINYNKLQITTKITLVNYLQINLQFKIRMLERN